METKHTPAPWVVKGNRIEGPDGETVAYVTEHETLTPRQQANARLIAAARELLEACIAMSAHYSASLDHQPAYVRIARAAIAKAEGR